MANQQQKIGKARPSTGFSKGFLLAKPNKSKPKPSASASAAEKPTKTSAAAAAAAPAPKENNTTMKRGFLLSKSKPAKKSQSKDSSLPSSATGETLTTDTTTCSKDGAVSEPKNDIRVHMQEELPAITSAEESAKPTASSSALLDLEDTPKNTKKSCLLFVADDANTQQSSTPNILVEDDKNEDDITQHQHKNALGMTEVSSSTKIQSNEKMTPISEYEPNNNSQSTRSSHDKIMERGNSVSRIREHPLGGGESDKANRAGILQDAEQPTSMTSLAQTDFMQCQQDLDRALWNIRRKRKSAEGDWRTIASEFCNRLKPEEELWAWIWECLFCMCPKESSQNLAERRLGCVMLECISTKSHWEVLARFLIPDESKTKESRLLTLGAITVLDSWASACQEKKPSLSIDWTASLLANVMPPLAEQVTNQSVRTLLAQRAAKTIYKTIVVATEQSAIQADHNRDASLLQQEIWNICSTYLIPVWNMQMNWNSAKEQPDEDAVEGRRAIARSNCSFVVLEDWKHSLHRIAQSQDGAPQEWCKVILGINMSENGTMSSSGFGSLQQTLFNAKHKWTVEDVVAHLKLAIKKPQGGKLEEAAWLQQAIARGALAWMGQSKQNFSWILDSRYRPAMRQGGVSIYQEIYELSNQMLRYALTGGVVKLTLEILDCLWADAYGLPNDLVIFCDEHSQSHNQQREDKTEGSLGLDLPGSINKWIDFLGCRDAPLLVESSEAISKLIAQSVAQICLGTPKGARLSKMVIEHLIEKNSLTKPTAEVLVATMKILQVSTVSDDNSSGGSNRQDLLDHIGHHFILRNIKTNSAVREVLEREHRKQIDPLSDCSVDRIVPELIHIIAKSVESPSKETASVLNASLVAILRQSLAEGKTSSEGVDLVVSEVTKALIDLVNEDESGESKGSSSSTRAGKMRTDQRIEEICSRLGLSWRQSLLNGGGPEQRAHEFFGRVLASVGREMFTFPKSTIPLTLLGAIVGDSQSYEDVGEKGKPEQVALGRWKRDVILNAARSVLELSVKGMNDLHEKREEGTPDEVFSRLAPLLLLRRIPPSLFRAAYAEWFRQENYRNTSLAKVLSRVANHLAARLDIKVDKSLFMKNSELNFTAEERQMAAEVAGRCLPFNNSSDVYSASTEQPPLDFQLYGFSCFQAICLPGLVEMSDILLKAEISCDHEEIRSAIRRARASIYATCHFIPFSKHFDDESIGKPLLAIASFCLQFLNTEQATFESTDLEQDWLQLQAGCIEFFAVCLQRRLSLCHSDEMETADSVASLGACFEDMHSAIVEIIRSTDTVPKTIRRVNRWLQECLPVDLKEKIGRIEAFSVPCRTCLWNSLIILSQRCNEGSNLQLWAKSTLAWLVTWSASGETQSEQHPLCLTAALQLAFILITCTKSFVGLASSDIQNLHRWAVRSIQDSKGCTDYANNSLRCAGLKLLLAVVTIGQLSDSDSENYNPSALVFSRRDLEETSRLIHGISKQDPDPKLQTLALHILSSGLFIC